MVPIYAYQREAITIAPMTKAQDVEPKKGVRGFWIVGHFAVGHFAVGHFAVGQFAVRKNVSFG